MAGRRRTVTGSLIPWRLARVRDAESVRWECVDGRWVALSLGQGDEMHHVVLTDSSGRRQLLDSYEQALALARVWRSPEGST